MDESTINSDILDGKYYFIFGINSIKNNGISKILSLKINELINKKNKSNKNINDYIITDLHNSLSEEEIHNYIKGINSISLYDEKIIFISLEIEENSPERSKKIINELKLKNIYYIDDFLGKFNTFQ